MAEFALGLTKTAVEGTLIRVKSAIEEEAKLKVRVQNDLLFISGEFQMMQSFLKLANKERAKNEVVLTWVRQIRDLAFDVEDCVEFVVHLDKPSHWDWVRRLASSVFVCMSPLLIDMAVAEIKQLRTKVEDISQRNTRYNLITNVEDDSKPAVIGVSSPVPKLMLPATASNTSSTTFCVLNKVWEAMGKKRHIMGGLKRLINNEGSHLEVISLWGSTSTAHLWVTHTFREAYNDPEICRQFSCRVWIKLMHPFNPDDFLKSLLTQLYATSSHHKENLEPFFRTTEEYHHLIKAELMQQVKNQRYLIILEDLFSVVEWDVIRMYLPDSNNGSRIVVATPQLALALSCMGEPYQVSNLRQFSDGQSLCAFFSRVCGHNSYMAEFIWQLRRPGVMSVLRGDKQESRLIDDAYRDILPPSRKGCRKFVKNFMYLYTKTCLDTFKFRQIFDILFRTEGVVEMSKKIEGSDFERHVWLDVTHQLSLEDFSSRLLSSLQSDDLQASETAAICMVDPMHIIEECHKFLRGYNCLVVINGLGSIDHWNMIKENFLSEPTKGCILIITGEEKVARHCVDAEDRAFNNKDLEDLRMMELLMERNFRKECHLHIGVHRVTRFFSGRQLEAFEWTEKFGLVGHQSEWKDLCDQLEGDPGVISLWGVAGVGKTTLVKHIYYTHIIGLSRSRLGTGVTKYSWVDVSYPFDLTDLSRSLLLDFHSDNLEAKETAAISMMQGQDPAQECRNIMCRVKSFVVICGLRSNQDWDLIKAAFLSEPIEGCILVVTNEASVARHCADDRDRVINVKGLEADAAFDLFTKNLTSRKINTLSPREVELSKIILTKCGGHLKVIATIREYCQKERETETALKAISDNFMGMLEKDPRFHNLKGLFCWMQAYFDACPDSLKPCIFYLSIFPCDHGFRRSRLLRRWIAEGYCRDKSTGSTAEEDGEMLYSKLVDLSIIQKKSPTSSGSSSKRVDMYQVNGFFREYIVSRPMEDNLVFALEGNCKPNSEHTGKHLTIGRTWDRDEIVFKSLDLSRLRSLTVFGKWGPFLISDNMRLLRVLDLENTSGVTDTDLEQIGKAVPRLKFLSLRGCEKISGLPDSLGDMKQLQTLDVRGTQIVKLPYVVIKLENLQYVRAGMPSNDVTSTTTTTTSVVAEATIEPTTTEEEEEKEEEEVSPSPAAATEDVVGGGGTSTFLRTSRARWSWRNSSTGDSLASSSWLSKLMKMSRHHSGNSKNYGVEVVSGVGTLTALRTIGVVNVSGAGKNGKAILEELKKLTQLRKLGVSGINRKNWQELCCAISVYPHLESLSVRLDCNSKQQKQDDSCCLDDIFVPPKTLKSLKLYGGTVQVSPVWLKKIDNLRKVHLEDVELIMSTQEDIDSLIELPHQNAFRRLCVKPIKDGRLNYGWYSEYDFKEQSERVNELKAPVLKIDCSSYKFEIVFGPMIPEFVKELVVHCSTNESSLELSMVPYLKSLEEIWLKGTYSNTLREHLQKIVAEHENKPVFSLGNERTQQSPEPEGPTPSAC